MAESRTLEILVKVKDLATGALGLIGKGFEKLGSLAAKALREIAVGALRKVGEELVAIPGRIIDATKAFLDQADAIQKLARALGTTTESLTAMTFAAEQNSLSQDELTSSTKFLVKAMEEARTKAGEQRLIFQQLGIEVGDFQEGTIDMVELFSQVADGLKNIQSPTERATILMRLFGRSGHEMALLLSEGRQGIQQVTQAAERFGAVVSEAFIRKADALGDRLKEVGDVIRSVFRDLLETALPTLTAAAKALGDFLADNRKEIIAGLKLLGNAFIDFAFIVANAFANVADIFAKVAQALNILVKAAQAALRLTVAIFKDSAKASEEARLGMVTVAAAAAELLTSPLFETAGKIDALRKQLEGIGKEGKAAAAGVRETGDAMEEAGKKATGFFGGFEVGVKEFKERLLDTVSEGQKAATQLLQGAQGALAGFFEDAITGARNFRDAFKNMVSDVLRLLARLLAEFAAARIFGAIFTIGAGAGAGQVAGGGYGSGFDIGGQWGQGAGASSAGGGGPLLVGAGAGGGGVPMSAGGGGGGGPLNVNIHIHTVDAEGLDQVLTRRRKTIEDIAVNAVASRRDVRVAFGGALMVATTVCLARHNTSTQRISTIGGIGFSAYTRALTIPSAFLPAGHDLVFITTGIAGNFIRLAGSDPTYVEVVPYFGTPQLGSPQFRQVFRQLFSFAPYHAVWQGNPGGHQIDGHTGQPFLMMTRNASWTGGQDFNVAAQLFFNGNPLGIEASFDLDAIAVQVWDLTELNTLGIWWEFADTTTQVDLPDASTNPIILQTINRTHGASVNWFVAAHVNLTPKDERASAQFWLDNGAGSSIFAQRFSSMLHGLPPGTPPRYDWQRYPFGNFRIATLPATWTLRSQARNNYFLGPSTIASTHFYSATFAVEMTHADFFIDGPTVEPQVGFWGTEDPWNGDAKDQNRTWPYYVNGIVMASVAAGPQAGRWRTLLEIDGAPVSSNFPLAARQAGVNLAVENIPQQRVVIYGFGGPNHWLTFRGNDHWTDPGRTPLKLDASDCFMFSFNGVLGVIPPAPVLEGPGPETPVVAAKETAVSVASLPELPFQPSYGTPVEVQGETRRTAIPAGYEITHPKFKRGRRRVRLGWEGLSSANATTLVTFAKALPTTQGAFRWKPTDDLAQRPWSIDQATVPEVDLGVGGPRQVSFEAQELLFYVP